MKLGNVNIDQAIRDVELRSWLAEESIKPLPDDYQARLDALEKIRGDLLERVKQSGVDKQPKAKATRLLAALFPHDFTTFVSGNKLDKFLDTMRITTGGVVPKTSPDSRQAE